MVGFAEREAVPMSEPQRARGDSPASSPSPLQVDPDEVAGVLAARTALGPEAERAVIAAFLERTGSAIDARVDQRLAARAGRQPEPGGDADRRRSDAIKLALGSIALGIPVTGASTAIDGVGAPLVAFFAWVAIAVINVVFNRSHR
jgi:hypothetical protein